MLLITLVEHAKRAQHADRAQIRLALSLRSSFPTFRVSPRSRRSARAPEHRHSARPRGRSGPAGIARQRLIWPATLTSALPARRRPRRPASPLCCTARPAHAIVGSSANFGDRSCTSGNMSLIGCTRLRMYHHNLKSYGAHSFQQLQSSLQSNVFDACHATRWRKHS